MNGHHPNRGPAAATLLVLLLGICSTGLARESYGGKTAAEWAAGLEDKDPFERVKAARALLKFGSDAAPHVSALIRALSDPESSVHLRAVEALGAIGPKAKAAIEALEAYKAKHAGLGRTFAESALAAIRGVAPDANSVAGFSLEQWKQAFAASDWKARGKSVKSAGLFGAQARPLLEQLAGVLKGDKRWEVRRAAALAIGLICRPKRGDKRKAEPALAHLEAALSDPAWQVRHAGATGLGRLKHLASSSTPKLIKCLDEERPEVRHAAARALGDLAAPSAIPKLRELLKQDKVPAVRNTAVTALAWIGKKQDTLTYGGDFVSALQDPSEAVRAGAAFALGANWMHPTVHEGIPALVKALADESKAVRSQAAWALGHFGKAAELALPTLEKLLKDPDPQVRKQAKLALEFIRKG